MFGLKFANLSLSELQRPNCFETYQTQLKIKQEGFSVLLFEWTFQSYELRT